MAKVKRDFSLNGKYYFAGDEIDGTYEEISMLNEKGYIEPLTLKELQEYRKPKKEDE